MASSPPRRDGLPVLGNAHQFAADPFAFLESLSATGEDVVRIDLDRPAYVALSPAAVRSILVDEHDAFERADFFVDDLHPLIGDGLLTVGGRQWRDQRDAVDASFFPDRIRGYGETIRTVAREQFAGDAPGTEAWAGRRVEVCRETREIGLEVVGRALLGTSVREWMPTLHDVADAVVDWYEVSPTRLLVPDWVPTPTRRRFQAAREDLEAIVETIVAAHRSGEAPDDDLVAMALSAHEAGPLDEREVYDLVRTFLLAGSDTTANAMANALTLLADHPAVADRLRAELDRELDGAAPTAADLPDLPYLEAVLDETLRLYPSAFSIYRQPTRDVEVAGYRIPEGRLVLVPQWAIHRDDRYYEAPTEFRPERWLDGEYPDYAFFPFGAGPFTCIGNRLATTEARLVVAAAIGQFSFDRVAGGVAERRAAITAQPADPPVLAVGER